MCKIDAAWGKGLWSCELDSAQLLRRQALLERALQASQFHESFGFAWSGEPVHDRRADDAESAWREVHLWDWTYIMASLVERVETTSAIVLCPGRVDLQRFSVRGALRAAARNNLLPVALDQWTAVPLWCGRGCARLVELAGQGRLPSVDLNTLHILTGPPPDEFEHGFGIRQQGVTSLRYARRMLEQMLAHPSERQRVERMLQRRRWNASLVETLVDEGSQLGVCVEPVVTRQLLFDTLCRARPGGSLAVLAHQDERGIHLADGILPICVLGEWLHRNRLAQPFESVDLSVCHVETTRNLADCFQAFGSPVVVTHGKYTQFSRSLGSWILGLRVLSTTRGTAISLPELFDRVWLMEVHCDA